MPVDFEPRNAGVPAPGAGEQGSGAGPIRIGLVNNMPDAALASTEAQFQGLLQAAAGAQQVTLRLSSFPEFPRSPEALAHLSSYWALDTLLAEPLDALIVTGTEPRAALLTDEPYWPRFAQLLDYANRHTIASIWSCLAAHAIVEGLHGIRRQRLTEKRCGVYRHSILAGHALLAGVSGPMAMPHSRWNELPLQELREAGYTVLSCSPDTGADAFTRLDGSLLLFFQGHPEYEDATLLKEYRRDVGRFLNGQQAHYPDLPCGYLSEQAVATLAAFRERALTDRTPALLESFPFAAIAATLENTWRPAAVSIYRNWLAFISAGRARPRAAAPQLRDRLLRVVGQILENPAAAATLPLDARLSDLGMSSIKMVNLMLTVEGEFDVSIPQKDITPENFRSVASVEALVLRLLSLRK